MGVPDGKNAISLKDLHEGWLVDFYGTCCRLMYDTRTHQQQLTLTLHTTATCAERAAGGVPEVAGDAQVMVVKSRQCSSRSGRREASSPPNTYTVLPISVA